MSSTTPLLPSAECHYFVDEGGDPHQSNRRKQVVVGTEGCSRFFIMGLLRVAEPIRLADEMEALRQELVSDPYFRNVPSMQAAQRKTAAAFHAEDDVAEVRREMFRLLLRHDVEFFAIIRDKARVAKQVRDHNQLNAAYRYHPEDDRPLGRQNCLHDEPIRLSKNRCNC